MPGTWPRRPQAPGGPLKNGARVAQTVSLADDVLAGKRRAIARAISLVESRDPDAEDLLRTLHGHGGDAHVVGVTGSPGTGKSTLADKLITLYRQQDKRVGVIAVDPSSPFTGGAILGDRIRMQSRATDEGVYIRSMGTRGALGGLSSGTADAVKVLAAAGFDVVIVETVGVGQAEVDVVRLADTVAVVVVPGLGDDVQAVKAGVMEIADIFVVNKADLDGSDKVHSEVEAMMMLGHPDTDDFWWPPILRTVAEKGEGVTELAEAVEKHRAWSQQSSEWERRRRRRLYAQVRDLLHQEVVASAFTARGLPLDSVGPWLDEARAGDIAPHDVADRILDRFCQARR